MTEQAPSRPSLATLLQLIALSLLTAVALAEVYEHVTVMAGKSWPPWVYALSVNSLLALVVAGIWARQRRLAILFSFSNPLPSHDSLNWLAQRPTRPYLPAAGIISGVLLLVAISRILGGPVQAGDASAFPWAWITWVPLVEELVFRVGIGSAFRQQGGVLWGSWFSAITFALVHGAPTLNKVATLSIGLPLGPFLLGLLCEALFVATGRIWPLILLHAACNASAPLFLQGDQRWLEWLRFLYT